VRRTDRTMPEESHLEEMNAAIRAQRERRAIPRTMVDGSEPPSVDVRPSEQPRERQRGLKRPGLLARLLGR
jgi:hypothetical protein